jgi:hypothetical protein
MGFDDAFHQRQAKANAALFACAYKRLKETKSDLLADTFAVVAYTDCSDRIAMWVELLLDRNADGWWRRGAPRRLTGIEQKIVDSTLEFFAVDLPR